MAAAAAVTRAARPGRGPAVTPAVGPKVIPAVGPAVEAILGTVVGATRKANSTTPSRRANRDCTAATRARANAWTKGGDETEFSSFTRALTRRHLHLHSPSVSSKSKESADNEDKAVTEEPEPAKQETKAKKSKKEKKAKKAKKKKKKVLWPDTHGMLGARWTLFFVCFAEETGGRG